MSDLVDQHITYLRAGGYSAATIHDRQRLLLILDRDLPDGLSRATTDDLAAWLARDGWSRWTRCTYFRHITAFYRWGTRSGHLDRDPSANLAKPRNPHCEPHPATDEQLAAALERSDPWWQRAIVLSAFAGLRTSEMARLRREDVTVETIRIVAGKGGKTKSVPCHPEIWKRIEPLGPGLVLPHASGQMVGHLSNRAREHFDAIGLPDVHLHLFRHRYATALLRGGADIRTVQSLMRHASLQTTAGYLDLVDSGRRDAVETLQVPGAQPAARPVTAGSSSTAVAQAIEALSAFRPTRGEAARLLESWSGRGALSVLDMAEVLAAFPNG